MDSEKVVNLVKKLDHLIDHSLRMLNRAKLQAKSFVENVGEVIRLLESEGVPNLPDQLGEEILPLAQIQELQRSQSIVFHVVDYRDGCVDHVVNNCDGCERKLTREVLELLEQIGLNENKLEKFLDETDFYHNWGDLRSSLVSLSSRQAVRSLLQASHDLKDSMNCFHDVVSESALLSKYLRVLNRFFGELQCEFSHELVEEIRDVVGKAFDAVCYSKAPPLISRVSLFPGALRGYSIFGEHYHLREPAIKSFYGKEGFRSVLLETLGKLHSITGEIDMICEKLGREDLQLRNAPCIFSHQRRCGAFISPSSPERKRSRDGSSKKGN